MATKIKLPSIVAVAAELRAVANLAKSWGIDEEDGTVDVRLQVETDGTWTVHSGDAQFDTDHRGFWGASSVPADGSRFNARDVAFHLLADVRDAIAEREECDRYERNRRSHFIAAWRFFRANAGGVVGQTALTALHLARAEQHASDKGWTVEWEHDDHTVDRHEDWCAAAARGNAKDCRHEILVASLIDENGTCRANLGGIIDPDHMYRRVIEAELALESLGSK